MHSSYLSNLNKNRSVPDDKNDHISFDEEYLRHDKNRILHDFFSTLAYFINVADLPLLIYFLQKNNCKLA